MKDAKSVFIDLLGVETIKLITKKNRVEFDRKPFEIYGTNEVEISFLKTDNKQDTVIFFSICYNEDDKKWFSENCIDSPCVEFDTYEEMVSHVTSIENKIINNGFDLAYLP
jgi:hypothetical protein